MQFMWLSELENQLLTTFTILQLCDPENSKLIYLLAKIYSYTEYYANTLHVLT